MTRISNAPARLTRAALIGSAMLAAGCSVSSGERIYNNLYMSYMPSNFRSMAAAGAPIEVHGAPPGGASAEEVVAAIQLPAYYASTAPRLADDGGQGQRLVFVFGLTGALDGDALCRGDLPGTALPDRLEVGGAYCRGERLLTQAQMTVDRPLGPPDPDFTRAMRSMIEVIAPRDDPNRDRNERFLLRR